MAVVLEKKRQIFSTGVSLSASPSLRTKPSEVPELLSQENLQLIKHYLWTGLLRTNFKLLASYAKVTINPTSY